MHRRAFSSIFFFKSTFVVAQAISYGRLKQKSKSGNTRSRCQKPVFLWVEFEVDASVHHVPRHPPNSQDKCRFCCFVKYEPKISAYKDEHGHRPNDVLCVAGISSVFAEKTSRAIGARLDIFFVAHVPSLGLSALPTDTLKSLFLPSFSWPKFAETSHNLVDDVSCSRAP